MGTVAHLFVAAAKHGAMLERSEVQAIENRGLEGCAHGRIGSRRQVLLVESEMLRLFDLAPGMVRENVTTEGVRLAELAAGERLRIGDQAVFEVTIPCEPCHHLEAIRAGLRDEMQGQRGILCRVIEGGWIRRGDAVEVVGLVAVTAEQRKEIRKAGSA